MAVSGEAVNAEAKPKLEDKKEGKEEEKPEFRMVVVGDADFASNYLQGNGRNADLFQNIMSWLSQEEDLIAIRPKPTNMSKFEITESRFPVINLASVIFAPLLMIFSALSVWFFRRRK